jgi:hypothetical protein
MPARSRLVRLWKSSRYSKIALTSSTRVFQRCRSQQLDLHPRPERLHHGIVVAVPMLPIDGTSSESLARWVKRPRGELHPGHRAGWRGGSARSRPKVDDDAPAQAVGAHYSRSHRRPTGRPRSAVPDGGESVDHRSLRQTSGPPHIPADQGIAGEERCESAVPLPVLTHREPPSGIGTISRPNDLVRTKTQAAKRKQNTIKTTTISGGRGRWATGPARRTHPNLNRAPSR